MHHLIFSFSSLVNSNLQSSQGQHIGVLSDIICNKDSGKISYLIIRSGKKNRLFALHHSFFHLPDEDDCLVFDHQLGRRDQPFYLDLPTKYDEVVVYKLEDFEKDILANLCTASHRSDNESHF